MKIQCLMLKIHENPIRLQDPKTKFEMAGPFCSPWIAQMVRKPWRRKTVRAPFCGATWAWGIYGDQFFRFFWGTHQSLAGLKWCETHRWSFLDTAFSSVFFKCTCVGRVRFLFILKRVSRVWNHWDYLTMEPSAEWQISSSFCLIFSDVSMFALRPIWNIQPYLFKRCFYPLVISHSYWTWPFIVDLPNENGDFPISYVYQRVDDLHSPWLFPHLKF